MKIQYSILTILALVSTFGFQPLATNAQGSLTPPGPPGTTMLTLSQVEPRTPITNTASLVTISQPGSYYLTANITVTSGNAIIINTNGVTLDLGGFTISSTAASATGYGILLNSSLRNITIGNGFIQGGVTNNGSGVYGGSGFAYGILYSGSAPVNVLVSRISVSGCLDFGIYLGAGDSTIVESCTVRTMGGTGINASTIKSSSAIDCGGNAIYGDQVSDCRGQTSGSGDGIQAIFTALNCYGTSSSGSGIDATTAENCYGYSSGTGDGLLAQFSASGCFGESSSGTGLSAEDASFCVGSRSGGTAISATIATGCIAAVGTNVVTYKYNMP
jgi:hypothetical protein